MAFRPAVRPGAPLLRRDATHLQVGTSPGIVFADRPGLLAFLRLLDGARDIGRLRSLARERVPELEADVGATLNELLALGAVVDGPQRPARPAYELAIHSDPGGVALADTTRSILMESGLTRLSSTEPDLTVVVSCGEPSRATFEQASLWGLTHLPVVIDEDRVRIGPLVRPGVTPCVGCHDLHRADWDPAWPALLLQLGRPATGASAAALAATTCHAAAVELAVEVLSHADGRRARSVGQCLLVGPAPDERTVRPVPFHHRCACDLLETA